MRNLETVWCCQHSRSQPRYPRFTLCLDCRAEAPYEAIVVEAVVNYFSRIEFQEFVIETEKSIRMGIEPRRADIVLLDGEGHFIAIAECKRTGVVTYGREQLKSYLCATDTQFGVFANSINPDEWEFYENLRRYRFTLPMGRSPFERKIATGRTIESIREEKDRLDREITEIRTELDRKGRKIKSSREQLNNLNQKEVKQANNQLAEFEKEIAPLREESTNLTEKITRDSQQAEVLEGLKLETTRDSLKETIDTLSSEKDQLQNEIGTKRQQHKRLSAKIDSLRERTNELKSELKDSNRRRKNWGPGWKVITDTPIS